MGLLTVLKPVGLTKYTGYEYGLRKTFSISIEQAWRFFLSPAGVRIWLGDSHDFRPQKGTEYHTSEGVSGVVRVVNPEVILRLTWQPGGWPKASTLQVRVIPAGEKTTISFHQENLPDAQAREQMRQHWENVMTDIEKQLRG